jgi:hypothetical protein
MGEYDEPAAGLDRNTPGAISLVFAALATACVPLGALVAWQLWFMVAPLAAFGALGGLVARGRRRVVAVSLNLLLFLLGAAVYALAALPPIPLG